MWGGTKVTVDKKPEVTHRRNKLNVNAGNGIGTGRKQDVRRALRSSHLD